MLSGGALILLMFGLMVALLAAMRLLGQSGEKKTASAVVVSKRTETADRGKLYQTPATVYVAVFRLDSGEELELSLEGADYAPLKEGQRGMLTWQGKQYLKFKQD